MLPVSTLRSSRKKAVAGDDDARGSLAGFASSGCSVWVQAWPVGLRTSSAWALLGAGPGIPWTRPPQPSPVGHSGGHRAALAMPFWPPEWFFCLWAVRRLHRGLPHGAGCCRGSWQFPVWTSFSSCTIVLVLAGIELIFFLIAGTVQCFGFSMRIRLITH